MATEQNKTVIRRYYEELWNKGNLGLASDIFAADAVRHDPNTAAPTRVAEAIAPYVAMNRTAFPDLHFTIDDLMVDGDKVVARWTFRGTHNGEYMGVPASGKQVVMGGIGIYRVAGGKITDLWVVSDDLTLMQQIGAFPVPH